MNTPRFVLVHDKKTEGPYGPFFDIKDLIAYAVERDLPADDWTVASYISLNDITEATE